MLVRMSILLCNCPPSDFDLSLGRVDHHLLVPECISNLHRRGRLPRDLSGGLGGVGKRGPARAPPRPGTAVWGGPSAGSAAGAQLPGVSRSRVHMAQPWGPGLGSLPSAAGAAVGASCAHLHAAAAARDCT